MFYLVQEYLSFIINVTQLKVSFGNYRILQVINNFLLISFHLITHLISSYTWILMSTWLFFEKLYYLDFGEPQTKIMKHYRDLPHCRNCYPMAE